MSRTVSSWHAAEASGDTDLQHNQGEESMLPSREYWRSKRSPLRPPLRCQSRPTALAFEMVIPLRPPLRFCGVNLTPKRWRSKRSPFVSSIAVLRWKSRPKAFAFETTLPLRFCGGNLTEKRWTFAPPAPLPRFLVNSQRPRPNPTVLYHKPLKMDPVF